MLPQTAPRFLLRGVGTTAQNLLDLGLGGGASALPSIAARVYGQSTQEALGKGDSREKAVQVGLARAAAELIPEGLSGGNPLTDAGRGKATLLRQTLDRLSSSGYVNNFVTKLGAGALGEGAEEVITQGLNDLISGIAYGKDAALSTPEEYAEAFWGGVIGSLYGNIVDPRATINNVRQDVDGIVSRREAAQREARHGDIATGAQAVQSDSGAFNTAETEAGTQQAQQEPTTVLDIYQNRGTRQENEAVQVGRATTIKKPYTGVTPAQERVERVVVPVSDDSLALANSRIAQAKTDSDSGNRSFRAILSSLYRQTFQPQKNIPVNSMTYEGQPYTVDVHKTVPSKVISDNHFSAEKMSVLDSLAEVIQNAQYVGSGGYGKAGKTNSEAIRYDYFETDVTIGGKEYTVLFDVEVLPSTNNYRTHRLVDIALTPQRPSNQLVNAGLSSAGSADTFMSGTNITQGETAVNGESQGDDGLGAANAGFDPVSQWQESTGRYHPVNEAAAQTTLEERGRVPSASPRRGMWRPGS